MTGGVVSAAGLNVAVRLAFAPNTALHGLVVPEHVEELRPLAALQPAKVDPLSATAVKVTVAPLSEVVILGEHVLETVCELAALPVPPHEVGALTVPLDTEIFTLPVPAPAKFKFQLRASVNVPLCETPDVWPVAVYE
ncbi:MAG: hypothetical protein C3F07_20765 [Anaerolineales bacterium]|nr:MAG: hypothetical protein C3F07_20765 [Anaerolineales bacterium]